MRSNLRIMLGAMIVASNAMKHVDKHRGSLVIQTPQKRKSTKKTKDKRRGSGQVKYSSTKPIKSQAKTQFRNKSNI